MEIRKTNEGEFVPAALKGDTIPVNYPDCFVPVYENNMDGTLYVCICDGCEDAKPRLKELASMFKMTLFFKGKDEQIKPISELFEK